MAYGALDVERSALSALEEERSGLAFETASPAASKVEASFRPIFIVGCQRSGTTALAVMFDRHSQIATLPETQYFTSFAGQERGWFARRSPRNLIDRALADPAIQETNLERAELVELAGTSEPDLPALFRALLEAYASKHGKPRPAEKSCGHLHAAGDLLNHYPDAKIICIVRDGRDVVRSLQRVPWGRDFPTAVCCLEWLIFARAAERCRRELPAEAFSIVRYEDLILEPEQVMRRLCDFVGEEFEPTQLRAGVDSDVVPSSEMGWKAKAKEAPDPSRVAAWRRCEDPREIALMNFHMGRMLSRMGYPDTRVEGVSWARRLLWTLGFLPFQRGVYRITRALYRVARDLRASFRAPEG